MSSPGGRIEIRIDPDLNGFAAKTARGLGDAGRTAASAFASAFKTAAIAAAVVVTAAVVSFGKSTLDIGMAYQDQLNTLQAVSGATAEQMLRVGATAKELGSDLTLPATSAADAAAVMTELAKASFTVEEAQTAARGSLQLAAAAQIDGARAAEIQANAINAFGLEASNATRVADVLANAANASSAEITDIADALAQASAVAAGANISIEDTATALGILANNGIKGSDAGTLVKSALLALQSPSAAAAKAMGELNLTAYDAQGNFVGLRSIFEQLQTAQAGMTQQQYEAATSTLFGSDAARLAGIAAREGATGWDTMATAIGRQGAAAEVAEAKSRGLRGAIEAFKSQVETVQIDIFERAAPSLERFVRLAAERLPQVAESALDTADRAVAYLGEVGPRIAEQLQARADAVERAWEKLAQPIIDGAGEIGPEVMDLIAEVAGGLADLGEEATDKLEPLAEAVGDLVESLDDAGGPLKSTATLLGVAADGAGLLLDAAGPLVGVVSTLVSGFSQIPGPLQTTIVALGALKLLTRDDPLGRMADSQSRVVRGAGDLISSLGRTRTSLTSLNDEVRLQQSLASMQTRSISELDRAWGGLGVGQDRVAGQLTNAQRQLRGWDDGLARAAAAQDVAAGSATRLDGQLGAIAARGGVLGGVASGLGQVAEAYRGGLAEAATATERYGLAADGFAQRVQGVARATQTAATVGIGGLKSAGAGLVSFLGGPWGVALAGGAAAVGVITAQMAESEQQAKSWGDALSQGGRAAQQALEAAKADDETSFMEGLGNLLTDDTWSNENVDGFVSAVDRAKQAAEDYRNSLGPLERAQLDVRRETNDVSLAIDEFGAGSPEAVAAAGNLAYAQGELARVQGELEVATESATEAIGEQVDEALAASDASIRLSQAQLAAKDAEAAYQGVMADAEATDIQRQQSLNNLLQAYNSQIAAAGQKAAADAAGAPPAVQAALATAAQVAELDALIAAGGPATGQLQALRAGMDVSSAGAVIAAAALQGVTGAVVAIPGEKAVRIDSLTEVARANLEALGFKVTNMPDGTVKVTAETAAAESSLVYLSRTRYATVIASIQQRAGAVDLNGAASGSGRPGLATGGSPGLIRGPGSGTSDTAGLWALSNGEFVIREASVAKYGVGFMQAVNAGLLDRSVVQPWMTAMRAQRAGAAGGRAAAGGYVGAQQRALALVATSTGDNTSIEAHLHAVQSLPTEQQLLQLLARAENAARRGRRRSGRTS